MEFETNKTTCIRIPVSLKFEKNAMYENFIAPVRASRKLTTLIQDLLLLYYENDRVRAMLEDESEDALSLDDLLQQVDEILATQRDTTEDTELMQTKIAGMNAYLEKQHEILNDALQGGIGDMSTVFEDFAEYTDNTKETESVLFLEDKASDVEDLQTEVEEGNTEVLTVMQELVAQVSTLCDRISVLEQKNNTENTETVNKSIHMRTAMKKSNKADKNSTQAVVEVSTNNVVNTSDAVDDTTEDSILSFEDTMFTETDTPVVDTVGITDADEITNTDATIVKKQEVIKPKFMRSMEKM